MRVRAKPLNESVMERCRVNEKWINGKTICTGSRRKKTLRRINDLIGDLFVAYPLALSIDLYRVAHMVHHRHTNTMRDYDYRVQRKDADQHFPKSGRAMVVLLLRSLSGLNYYRAARAARIWSPLSNFHNPMRFGFDFRLALRVRYIVWAVLVYGAILWSPWRWQILGLFMIPQFIWANVFNRLRAMAEHNGVTDETEIRGTRTVIPTLIDRILIGPLNVSYHLEHHLFPSVPWHNLRRLHRHLMASDPLCARCARYAGLLGGDPGTDATARGQWSRSAAGSGRGESVTRRGAGIRE